MHFEQAPFDFLSLLYDSLPLCCVFHLQTEYEKVRKVFGENQEGAFLSVPREKIRQIAQQASSSSEGGRTHGGRWRGPFNLFEKHPAYSNQHGQMYEVDSSDYPALQAQSISVAYAIIRGVSSSLLLGFSFDFHSFPLSLNLFLNLRNFILKFIHFYSQS